jgi:hypothetical protein
MREIRSYGSVRGVRSNPYPYRDEINPVRSTERALDRSTPSSAGAIHWQPPWFL